MRRRVMMVLTGVALAGSLLATDARAHGGGGQGGGGHGGSVRAAHMGGFGEARVGGLGRARVGGVGAGYAAGIPQGAVGYVAGPRDGVRTGYETGIRYGTGILRDRLLGLAESEYAQTATPDNSSEIVPATAEGAARNSPIEGPFAATETVGMAAASSAAAPSNTQSQDAPAFQSGNLVRLRSGGPLMTVESIKGDQVDCFWTDLNGQINADRFPVDVLQKQ
jgi:uncharacterized protein YodC (DUF2158 family)